MKAKHLTSALVLILVLAVSSFGGIIDCPAPSSPPSVPSSATAPREIGLPGGIQLTQVPGSVVEGAQILLQNLLSVL
ncbi:MAG: hypothetical protein JWM21_4954 [Acidobacteria bacterium]|nr:hypothetical protein [Acidobacteriota bacterium]